MGQDYMQYYEEAINNILRPGAHENAIKDTDNFCHLVWSIN
jgi:hypothetical protein